jgi:hypothetical protein
MGLLSWIISWFDLWMGAKKAGPSDLPLLLCCHCQLLLPAINKHNVARAAEVPRCITHLHEDCAETNPSYDVCCSTCHGVP